jgi:hypothetical protein
MKDLQDLDWDTILDYIESEQAALLIGPEVMHFDGQPMNKAWRGQIWDKFRAKIAYNYEQDGLFLFSNKIAKNDAARFVRKFVNEREPEEAVYQKIAQIKFPLVVSINPDTYLSDVAHKYGVRHRFSYFKSRSKATDDVEEPQKELPLFYNLCGVVNDDESIILDYEDLFRLIASSVSAPGLPPKLQTALDKVRLFLFIGFQFENWHTQLLLRLLCGHEQTEKYAASRQHVDDETRDFLLHQFQIEFLEKDQSFLDALHDKCRSRNLLRNLANPASAEEIDIIKLIQTGKDLAAPLDVLRRQTDNTPVAHEATLLMGRYNSLMEEKNRGVMDSRDYFVEYNRLIDAILTTARQAAAV